MKTATRLLRFTGIGLVVVLLVGCDYHFPADRFYCAKADAAQAAIADLPAAQTIEEWRARRYVDEQVALCRREGLTP